MTEIDAEVPAEDPAQTRGAGSSKTTIASASGQEQPLPREASSGSSGKSEQPNATLAIRACLGGLLMGLANLVPGISGGTMLLAVGVYPKFIDAVAEVTRFRFALRSIQILACVVGTAAVAVLLGAGTIKDLVVEHRWVMYSLFIGLTLGGVPVVWRLARPATPGLWISAAVTGSLMGTLALLQAWGVVGVGHSGALWLFIAGLAGASAMILPGISGGYLLLLLGQYLPILNAIDEVKSALRDGDVAALIDPVVSVVLPVGLGVVAGVVAVGNLLQWMLHHYRRVTLGALLGLLLGSVIGLWPFQQTVPPSVGDVIKGQTVTEESIGLIEPDDWPTEFFRPSTMQVVASIGLIGIGFIITLAIAHIGSDTDPDDRNGSKSRLNSTEPGGAV